MLVAGRRGRTSRLLLLRRGAAALTALLVLRLLQQGQAPWQTPTHWALAAAAGVTATVVCGSSPLPLELSTGVSMQVLRRRAAVEPELGAAGGKFPLLVFVHGSLHGAWCWDEQWMPELARRGLSSVALNLRGTAGCSPPSGADEEGRRRVVSVQNHVDDLESAVDLLLKEAGEGGVVLVAHSMGALKLMKLMERPGIARHVAVGHIRGIALLCSVPPTGQMPVARRTLLRRPLLAWRIVRGIAAKGVLRNDRLCRDLFLNPATSLEAAAGVRRHLRKDSQYGLELKDIKANLPASSAVDPNRQGIAAWVGSGGQAGLSPDRILVLGSTGDAIVDAEGLQDTARFVGTSATLLEGVAHDVMLDVLRWRYGCDALHSWVLTL